MMVKPETKTEWPSSGPDYNSWHLDLARFMAILEDNPFGVSPDLLVNVSYGWKVQTFTVVDSVTKKYIISMSDSAFKDYYQKDESV